MEQPFQKLTHKLLNFSRRNRILHCPDRKTGIKFRDVSYFVNEAILKEDSLSFEFDIAEKDLLKYEKVKSMLEEYRALKKQDSEKLEFDKQQELEGLEQDIFQEVPDLEAFLSKNEIILETVNLDDFFSVPLSPWGKDLITRLNRYRLNTKRISDEHGQYTLHLSFGVLKWKDPKEKVKEYFSPLLFFPAEISVKKNPKRFFIKDFEEGAYQGNHVLNLLLNKNFGAPDNIIPPLEYGGSFHESIEAFFEKLDKNLKEHLPSLEYEIIRSVKFENFALDALYWEAKTFQGKYQEDELIKILCGETYNKDPLPPLPNANNLDALDQVFTDKNSNNCVLEADSSQLEVIYKAQSGANLVVTGPPGTGKSQTIVNLISDFVARGKKVLFVCAKKVALEVVYDRLKLDERNNLQKLAMPLFETNVNKKEFYNSIYADFKERAEAISKKDKQQAFAKQFAHKQNAQETLNNYAEVLLTPTGEMQVSPWYAYGQWAKSYFSLDGENLPFKESVYSNVSLEKFQQIEELIQKLSNFSHLFSQEKSDFFSFFDWEEYSPAKAGIMKQKIPVLEKELDALVSAFQKIKLEKLLGKISVNEVEILAEDGIKLLRSLKNSGKLDLELKRVRDDLEDLIAKYKTYKDKNIIEYKQDVSVQEFESVSQFMDKDFLLKSRSFDFYSQQANLDTSLETLFTKIGIGSLEKCKKALSLISQKPFLKEVPLCEIFRYSDNWEFFSIFNRWDPSVFSSDVFKKELISFGIALKKINSLSDKLKEQGINLDKISYEEIEGLYFNFQNNYTSFLSRFSGAYKNDYQKFRQYFYGNVKFSKKDILATLQNLRSFCHQQEEIKNLAIFNSDFIKRGHVSNLTQWDEILEGLERVQNQSYPLWLTNALKHNISEVVECFKEIHALIVPEQAQVIFDSLFSQKVQNRINAPQDLKDYIEYLEKTYSVLKSVEQFFEKGTHWTLRTLPSCIKEVDQLNKLQKEFIELISKFEKVPFSPNFFAFSEREWEEAKQLFACTQSLVESLGQEAISSFLSSVKSSDLAVMRKHANKIRDILPNMGAVIDESQVSRLNILTMQNCVSDAGAKVGDIKDWMRYRACLNDLYSQGFEGPIKSLVSQKIEKEKVCHAFFASFWAKWLEECGKEKPILWETGINLASTVAQFSEYDKKMQKLKCQEILEKYSSLNELENTHETRALKEQANKKRSHMPLRKFIPRAQTTMFQLKKCWLMSPQALVNYLPLENQTEPLFDVVIFDEASQLTPQEAMAGLVRGKQVIVVGDSKQLPPTRFFIKSLENDDEEDDERFAVEDYESVLDILSVSFPETQQPMLRWHYRCKYESLIAASNKYFYRNKLITFPSNADSKEGLEFNYRKDIYDRGASQTNRGEAERIVETCFEFWNHVSKTGQSKSLGVICLNSNQEEMVRDLLEAQIREHGDVGMASFFDENSNQKEEFFIKNLENVQGDERDVIFLSVGYGYDESGSMKNIFGPIDKAGGNRRLNVAISRAREKMIVFSSLRHEDIKGRVSEGGKILRNFLQYAEMCPQVGIEKALFAPDTEANSDNFYNDTDSPFEDSVLSALENLGYSVHKQIGVSGFRIDLAIVDPNDSGRYLLGVECDGATYHGTRCARERDRLRQEILERRGWEIFRIWSTDWFSDSGAIINDLQKTIQGLLTKK